MSDGSAFARSFTRSLRERLGERATLAPLDVAGVVFTFVGLLWLLRSGLQRPANPYDEGILLTNADALRRGDALYKDFYSLYPPGSMWIMAGLFSIFGASYTTLRVFGFIVRVALALVTGRLAGRCSGKRFSLLGCGFSLLWLMATLSVPFAWMFALLVVLVVVELTLSWWSSLASGLGGVARQALLGALLGLVGWIRHDLFGEVAIVSTVALIVVIVRPRCVGQSSPGGVLRALCKRCSIVAVTSAAVLAVLWLPTIRAAGVGVTIENLIHMRTKYLGSSRDLPIANPFSADRHPSGLVLPAFLTNSGSAGLLVLLIMPVLAARTWLRGFRRARANDEPLGPKLRAIGLVGLVAVAVLPQYFQRADNTHVLFALSPALVLLAGMLERFGETSRTGQFRVPQSDPRPRVMIPASAVVPTLFVALLVIPTSKEFRVSLSPTRTSGVPVGERFGMTREKTPQLAAARSQAVAFLRANSAPDERVFSGCSGRRFLANELDLYFLADRRGATRFQQFDPGLQTDPVIQRQMIDELRAQNAAAIVLADCLWYHEPNTSRFEGADLLNTWIRRNYRRVDAPKGYEFYLRR